MVHIVAGLPVQQISLMCLKRFEFVSEQLFSHLSSGL